MASGHAPGPRHHPGTLLFRYGGHIPDGTCLQPSPLAAAVSGGWGTCVPPHLLYLVSKRIQGMHRDGSDGLEIEGCGGSLKGWSGWDFPWEKVYGMR